MTKATGSRLGLPFRWVALATAVLCVFLAFMNATNVDGQLESWDLATGSGATVLALRTGAIYLGLAVLLALASGAAPSRTRDAISYGSAAITGLLAAAAFYSATAGEAGNGILQAGVVELVLAVAFLLTTRQRHTVKEI